MSGRLRCLTAFLAGTVVGVSGLVGCGGVPAGGKALARPEPSAPPPSLSTVEPLSTPPPAGITRDAPFPVTVHRELPNGLQIRVVTRRQHPIVEIRLVVFSGQSSDGPDTGLSAVSGELLKEGGAGKWDSRGLLERVESLGSSLNVITDRDSTRVALGVTSADFEPALEVISALAQSPRLSPDEFEKLKQREIERVRSAARGSPGWVASMVLYRELYEIPAAVHPYAYFDATPTDLQRLNLFKCRTWHSKHFKPRNAELIVVGDVDPNAVEAATKRLFGDWKGERPTPPSFSDPTPPVEREVFLVDRQGASQSEVYVATLGPERRSEDWPALATANQILGGGPSSRLFLDLREKRSLAYRTNSFLEEPARGPVPIVLGAGTQTPKTGHVVAALLENLERLGRVQPVEQEVLAATRFLSDSFLFRTETAGAVADMVSRLAVLGLPDNYYDDYRRAVRSMNAVGVQATAGQYYRPRHTVVVVSGDATQLGKPLSHFGKVTIINPEANFTPGQQHPFDPNQSIEIGSAVTTPSEPTPGSQPNPSD